MVLLVGVVTLTATLPQGVGAIVPQDDAGSGQDAPDNPRAEVWVASGESYTGTQEGILLDAADHYAFNATAGDSIQARASGPVGCFDILDEDGNTLTEAHCTVAMTELATISITAPETGTYFLLYEYLEPQEYAFSLGVEEPAPDPLPVDTAPIGTEGVLPDVSASTQSGQHTVVAVVDTGINPYHDFFEAPALSDHPSTWLDGFPQGAQTVDLTLDAGSYDTAVSQDEATWDGLAYTEASDSMGTQGEELYTFPGTRVVAGISFGEYGDTLSSAGDTPVLDEHGHGTGSAGLAAGSDLSQADGNVLVVAVEVGAGQFEDGFWWAARQPWIDAITASLGTIANVPVPPVLFGDQENSAPMATKTATDNGKPFLVASGNGVSGTGLAADHCSTHTSAFTGPSWVTRIGAAEQSSGNPSTWHCLPVEAIAKTPAPSVSATSLSDQDSHSGTSASTPNVAGHLADLVLETRRQAIATDPQEALDHLLHAAQPEDPSVGLFAEPSLPAPASVVDQGYGRVDEGAVDRAFDTLAAGQGPTPRPVEDRFFATDAEIRDALWAEDGLLVSPGGGLDATGTSDDAGSGEDAPEDPPSDLVLAPDTVYEGAFDGLVDRGDVYALPLDAGDTVEVAFRGELACLDVWDPDGEERDIPATCTFGTTEASTTFTADQAGTWHVGLSYFVPNHYNLAYGVDGPAPALEVPVPAPSG